MPDADHAPDFWTSVANTFKNNSAVIFDLYNEPYLDNNQDTTAGWECWKVLRNFLELLDTDIFIEWWVVPGTKL